MLLREALWMALGDMKHQYLKKLIACTFQTLYAKSFLFSFQFYEFNSTNI